MKKAMKEAKGKEYNLKYRLAAHEIVPVKDGYLFLAEAFYPTYNNFTVSAL